MTDNGPVDRKPIFYRSPMNPQVTSPVPRRTRWEWDYVAVYADDGESEGLVRLRSTQLFKTILDYSNTKNAKSCHEPYVPWSERTTMKENVSNLHPKGRWLDKGYPRTKQDKAVEADESP